MGQCSHYYTYLDSSTPTSHFRFGGSFTWHFFSLNSFKIHGTKTMQVSSSLISEGEQKGEGGGQRQVGSWRKGRKEERKKILATSLGVCSELVLRRVLPTDS